MPSELCFKLYVSGFNIEAGAQSSYLCTGIMGKYRKFGILFLQCDLLVYQGTGVLWHKDAMCLGPATTYLGRVLSHCPA